LFFFGSSQELFVMIRRFAFASFSAALILNLLACGGFDGAIDQGAGGEAGTRALGTGGASTTGSGGAANTGGGGATGGTSAAGGGQGTGGSSDAGSAGSGGSSGTGGTTGGSALDGGIGARGCPKFASGVNVAWIRFGNDVPNPNIASFTTLFQNTRAAGGRIVRWWFHANGTVTPGYDGSGYALPISSDNIADIERILDAAVANGVMINLSLWSFDMLQTSANRILAQNNALLTQDVNRQKYIDNVLTPLVNAVKGHPGLYSWETFNEPEGLTTQHGFVPVANRIDERFVQITVNWFADAIHAADPAALVTNGAWTFTGNSSVPRGGVNFYSDAALIAAGGRPKGTLDFYEVHYYMSNGATVSPFVHPSSFFNLDKRTVIGEFWALDTDGVAAANLYTSLYDNGYNGAWAWQYQNNDNTTSSTKWPAMQVPLQTLLAAHPADLACP
jgi:hypothetical protein